MQFNDSIKVQYVANQAEIDFVWEGIYEYNKTIGPMMQYPPYEPFRVILRNEKDEIIAGLFSKIYLKVNYIESFWIAEPYRKKGIGNKLLKLVEEHAKEKGCTLIHLDTFSFQAIDFYKKYGYEVFGVLDDFPDNVKRYFIKKHI